MVTRRRKGKARSSITVVHQQISASAIPEFGSHHHLSNLNLIPTNSFSLLYAELPVQMLLAQDSSIIDWSTPPTKFSTIMGWYGSGWVIE